ncbi:MAG: hypothetical protein IJ639_09095 [Ruminococcus sp.]|nr:hypothetical protein [Ruminococcus sp.]
MPYYLINKKPDERNLNEIHQTTCIWKPDVSNQVSLGYHSSNKQALEYAKSQGWNRADGCFYCCPDIHHG